MRKFESEFGPDDVVYTADAHGVKRRIVKSVKFKDDGSILYYFAKEDSFITYGIFYGNTAIEYKESELFVERGDAVRSHEALKALKDAQELEESARRREERKKVLRAELAELEGEHV